MDSPRLLQDYIHNDFTVTSGAWISYRSQITGLYSATGYAASGTNVYHDFAHHLVREYNHKIERLSLPTGLFLSPYDAGYSFTGLAMV
jgi:hypothetical protein